MKDKVIHNKKLARVTVYILQQVKIDGYLTLSLFQPSKVLIEQIFHNVEVIYDGVLNMNSMNDWEPFSPSLYLGLAQCEIYLWSISYPVICRWEQSNFLMIFLCFGLNRSQTKIILKKISWPLYIYLAIKLFANINKKYKQPLNKWFNFLCFAIYLNGPHLWMKCNFPST